MKSINLYALLCGLLFLCSCKNQEGFELEINYYTPDELDILNTHFNLPNAPLDYTLNFPEYYNNGSSVEFDSDKATLGRVLFYDHNLSQDRSVSCASCHKQELAFSDDVAFSEGIVNRQTSRNSQPLGSVFSFQQYYGSISFGQIPFFWDNRADNVEEQSRQTLANPLEMGMDMHQVLQRVQEHPYYTVLHNKAYGEGSITQENILDALSTFVNTMGSFSSKFDDELAKKGSNFGTNLILNAKETFAGYSALENLGKSIYMDNCSSCHSAVIGAPSKAQANNGLDLVYADKGVGDLPNTDDDMNGTFKVPTLRNIMLTAPYMHDGRFATINDVLDFYSNGIQNHTYLDSELKVGNQAKTFNFSPEDKEALIAFFETLTDYDYISSEKYSNPFK